MKISLSQALKLKNRIAGQLVKAQEIFSRENSRRSDNPSQVDRKEALEKIFKLSDLLGDLKSRIATANVPIYSDIERLNETKSLITYIIGLNKTEGPDIVGTVYNQPPKEYTWDAHLNQQSADNLIEKLQQKINAHQDKIDAFNATTIIDLPD